MLRLVCV